MTDSEMLDWLQHNATSFVEDDVGEHPFTLRYLNGSGVEMYVTGANIRDCVIGAKLGKDGRPFRG